MENGEYVFAAFSVVWAVLFGYVLVLVTRQKRLQREVESLKEMLREKKEESQRDGSL